MLTDYNAFSLAPRFNKVIEGIINYFYCFNAGCHAHVIAIAGIARVGMHSN